MTNQHNSTPKPSESIEKRGKLPKSVLPILLFATGVLLGAGYLLHLAGFSGWMTLAIAGVTLFVAGALWGDLRRFAWLGAAVALFGAVMCTMALPAQLQNQQMLAAAANFSIIAAQIAVVVLIWVKRDVILTTDPVQVHA